MTGGAHEIESIRAPQVQRRRRVAPRWRIWPISALIVAACVAAALILPSIERHEGWTVGIQWDPSTAQATLAAIAGGMITLTGFVFTAVTLIIQTLQTQSPRLLLALDRSDRTPVLFGVFSGGAAYALVVLSRVTTDFVPSLSVTLAIALVLLAIGLFLRLLVTMRTSLNPGGLVRIVGDRLRDTIDRFHPAPESAPESAPELAPGPAGGWDEARTSERREVSFRGNPGVFQSFDERAVVRLADAAGAVIEFTPAVGDFVAQGTVIAVVHGGRPIRERALTRYIHVGPDRTLEQDPAYGVRLLADVAVRALSPAVNDPTSAVQTLDQLDDILHRLVTRSLGEGMLLGRSGVIRVRYRAPQWESYLALALDEIRIYGRASLQVMRRMRALLLDLALVAPADRMPAIQRRLEALDRAAGRLSDHMDVQDALVPDRQGLGSP